MGRVCRQEGESVNRDEKRARDSDGEEWGRKALPKLMGGAARGRRSLYQGAKRRRQCSVQWSGLRRRLY